jgi:parallel beta-helix repeat protein
VPESRRPRAPRSSRGASPAESGCVSSSSLGSGARRGAKPVLWVAFGVLAALGLAGVVTRRPAPAAVARRQVVELSRFLPKGFATDGSADATVFAQRAIDAAAGRTLVLPPFPLRVSPRPGVTHCLLVREGTRIVGGPGSELVTHHAAVQALRIEECEHVALEGFALRGAGGVGQHLAHGLLQVWRCEDVVLRGLSVRDADADAIAIADSGSVRVEGCLVERGSKAGIYLTNCTASVVDGNVVRDTVGHVAPGGQMVGAGILLLSNADLACTSNVVLGGVGAGILCGANDLQRAPEGIAIVGNRIRGVTNPTNPSTSSGIRLANGKPEKRTRVLVASNSISGCGQHGILVDNHDGATIAGNAIEDSWMSAIAVGHSRAVVVAGNTILDANVAGASGQAGVYLHPTTSECVVRDNVVRSLEIAPVEAVIDRAPAGANRIE